MNRRRSDWTRGALVSLMAAVGLLVGLRSIVLFELPGLADLLGLALLPREGLGVDWSPRAVWGADVQIAGLRRLLGVVAALFLAGVAVAVLNATVLLAESSSARRQELAVRGALGAAPSRLVGMLLREVRTLLAASLTLGVLLGLAAGGAIRSAWPGVVRTGPGWASAAGDLFVPLLALLGLVLLAHVGVALRVGRGTAAADALRAGARSTSDAAAVFFRRVAPAVHIALAGAVLLATISLGSSLTVLGTPSDEASPDPWIIRASAPSAGAWERVWAGLEEIPGLEAESLASPGALVGLGIRDIATTECGPCSIGVTPTPVLGAVADHHAVSPGYFAMAGIDILEGRGFTDGDTREADRVAIVNQTFAWSSFHNGEAVGRRIRIGRGFSDWYMVVGIVEDDRLPMVGMDELPREAVFLPAAQQPVRTADLLLVGGDDATAEAQGVLAEAGFQIRRAGSAADMRRAVSRPLLWVRNLALALALIALILAAHGVYSTALQVTRRRHAELAIRRAVGASDRRILTHVLGERVKVALWGSAGMAFWGSMGVAFLRRAAGTDLPPASMYLGVAGLLVTIALLSSLRAAKEALAVEPALVTE